MVEISASLVSLSVGAPKHNPDFTAAFTASRTSSSACPRIYVCGNAKERCPVFPGEVKVVHVPFDDPPAMARDLTGQQEILDCYRTVRDQINSFVQNDLKSLL